MKLKNAILSLLIIFTFTFNVNSGITNSKIKKAIDFYSGVEIQNRIEYTYIKVYENGSWWIYVYDGYILIDRYWIED